jgi:hypothetical protein
MISNCHSEGSLTEESHVRRKTKGKSRQRTSYVERTTTANQCDMTGYVTIDVLPDGVLLEIFRRYLDENAALDAWHTLVHVSRNWRCVVFDSPRRLNLQLHCLSRTPVREMLSIWPPLPIIIWEYYVHSACNEDNIIAALEQHDRVCEIRIVGITTLLLEKLLAVTQEPFPALTYLVLVTVNDTKTAPIIPHIFLGGFAPNLRSLSLTRVPIPFPVLRKLLLSTADLVTLSLCNIPHSGYISPEAMVTCLSALTNLERLDFGFECSRSRPSREIRRPPPPMRALLPALRDLVFTGVSEYLEDLVARIDVPPLCSLDLTFFHQLIFDTPQLAQFIGRCIHGQKADAHSEARVFFSNSHVYMHVWLPEPFFSGLEFWISCGRSDWQLSAVAQICGSSLPHAFMPTVERLYIREEDGYLQEYRQDDDIESSQWLELLHPFTGVKHLFLSQKFAPRIVPALEELIGEGENDVLPALQSIHLGGLQPSEVVPKVIEQFVTARQVSGHPIDAVAWNGR